MKLTIVLLSTAALMLCGCPPSPTPPPGPDASDGSVPMPMGDAAPTPPPAPVADASAWDGNVPPPPGLFDAGDLADQVCSHLQSIGCSQPSTCAATIRKDQGKMTDFKLPCLLSASTKAGATSCKSVVCP